MEIYENFIKETATEILNSITENSRRNFHMNLQNNFINSICKEFSKGIDEEISKGFTENTSEQILRREFQRNCRINY